MFLISKYSLLSHPFLAATNLRLLVSLLETFLTLGGRLALELRVKSAASCSNSGTCILSFKPPNKFLIWVLIAGEDRDSRRLGNLLKVIQLVSGQSGTWGQYVCHHRACCWSLLSASHGEAEISVWKVDGFEMGGFLVLGFKPAVEEKKKGSFG